MTAPNAHGLPAPFGRYELLEHIGQGGMADIFLARAFGAAGFEKKLVIKRIKPEHAQDPRFVNMFIHEARLGVHLNHPNLVAVYELGKVGSAWYIAMEWVHGPDLNRVLRRLRATDEPMPPGTAVRIMAEALRGLGHAHGLPDVADAEVGMIHRDISPHNLLVTFTGDVKVVDFGVARLLEEEATRAPPAPDADLPTREAGGKQRYMSPEQARGESVDARSDLYSAGLVLWEMLTGTRQFADLSPDERHARRLAGEIQTPADVGASVDPSLNQALQRALAADPRHRYATALDFEEDLRAWMYRQPEPPARDAIATLVHRLFPDARADARAEHELRQLADDLRQLEGVSASAGSDTGSLPPPRDPAPRGPVPSPDERKRVAAMVIDVDGFTGISARAEPEALFQRHLALLRWMREVLDKHGGTLQHMHDDQFYALFGIERTRRDDLDRALACATELQRRVGELERQGLPVALAIGVHTGDVTVGQAGGRTRYVSRGNTTRLARRLSEQSDHGQILTSDAVQRAMESTWSFQRGPWLLGRGGRSPDPTWTLGPRRALSHQGPPWLRRGDEIDILQRALRKVAEGGGAVVMVEGDAGTGKSRLVGEVARLADRRSLRVLTARATPFGHPLAVARDLLLDVLGLAPEAEDAEVREAVGELLPMGLGPRDRERADALLGLRRLRIEPHEAWQAVRRVLIALTQSGPAVVVLEDLHHLPEPVVRSLGQMIRGLADAPLLQLLTCQGRCPDPLADSERVVLGPLPDDLLARMAALHLGARRLDPVLRQHFLDTCEGNPLYVQELARYLLDRGHVTQQAGEAQLVAPHLDDLPDTLAGLFAARLDALDPASKGALQIAAVIGPSFRLQLLGDATGLDDPSPIIDDLAAHGLIRRTPARGVWTFASEFVRQCALRTSRQVQRSDHHRLVAEALERRLGDDPDPGRLARLARHCGEGRRPIDAARYAYRAGREAEASHQLEQATTLYRDGIRWLQEAGERADTWEARTQGEAMLRLRLGRIQLRQGQVRQGMGALRIALDASEEAGLTWAAIRAHLALGWHHVDAGDLSQARAHLDLAWRQTLAEDDLELELEVTEARAALALAEGRTDEAAAVWEEMTARLPDDGAALRARTLSGLARVAVHAGDAAGAARHLESALVQSREARDPRLEARMLEQLGRVALWGHRVDEARRRLRATLSVREALGHGRGIARTYRHLAEVHLVQGETPRAHAMLRQSRDVASEAGWRHGTVLAEAYLAALDGHQGDPTAPERLRQAIEEAQGLGDHESALRAHWLLAHLQASQGDAPQALARLADAEAEARRRHLDPLARFLRQTSDAVKRGPPLGWPAPPP